MPLTTDPQQRYDKYSRVLPFTEDDMYIIGVSLPVWCPPILPNPISPNIYG